MKAILDSSALIELLLEGPRAKAFLSAAEKADELLVPALCVFETHRYVAAHRGEAEADAFADSLMAHRVCPLDGPLAAHAARLARRHKLALADSIIYATAQAEHAELWTQDADFKDLPGVHYLPKKA